MSPFPTQVGYLDTQHLPPLKSKISPGTLFTGTNGASSSVQDSDSMSINGSIVSNSSATSGAAANSVSSLANGHATVNGHVNGMATLPLVRPTTGEGQTSLESPKHGAGQQNGSQGERTYL